MSSFQAKIGWERPRKRENKNKNKIFLMGSYKARSRKFKKKIAKKLEKIKKTPLWHLFKPK